MEIRLVVDQELTRQAFALWNMGALIGDLYQGALGQYPCPFMITLGVHVRDPEATQELGQREGLRALNNRMPRSYMARFQPELHSG